MSSSLSFRLRDIVPSQEALEAMGRRRYQRPNVFKTKSKRPEWYFRPRIDVLQTPEDSGAGRKAKRPEQRKYLGYCDEMGKREAEKLRDEILAEVINRPQVLIPSQVRFSEVLRAYERDHLPSLRDTTQYGQESAIRKHLEPGLGKLRMCDLDVLAIQRWLSSMAVAYYTKQFNLTLLRVIWHKAQDWGFTAQPFPRARFSLGVKRTQKGNQMPTMEQLRRLIAALDDPYRAMAEVALYSGLRISEVRGLKWEDVGPETLTMQRRISQRGSVDVTKSAKERVFDVRPLAAVLARLPRASEWIFNHDGCSYRNCLYHLHAARVVAGIAIPRFGWHHLRACFNTLARSSGADSVDRQALMGHANEKTNAIYVMQADSDVRRRGDLMMAVQALVIGETKGIQ